MFVNTQSFKKVLTYKSKTKIIKNAEYFVFLRTCSLKVSFLFLKKMNLEFYGEEESSDSNTRDGAIYGTL